MQVKERVVAEGKSAVTGVSYDRRTGMWVVNTRQVWGVKQRQLATARTRERAEALAETYFPRLEAAAADDRFNEALAAARAEVKCNV